MSDDSRILWCLVDGDSRTFEVLIPANANVNDLRKLILEELRTIRSQRNITADTACPSYSTRFLSNLKTLDDDLQSFATKLGSTKKMRQIFPQPPCEDHIHIIVKPRPAGVLLTLI